MKFSEKALLADQLLPNPYCSKPETCDVMAIQRLSQTLPRLVNGLAKGNIAKLYENGFTTVRDYALFDKKAEKRIRAIKGFGDSVVSKLEVLSEALDPDAIDTFDKFAVSGVFCRPGFSLGDKQLEKLAEAVDKIKIDPKWYKTQKGRDQMFEKLRQKGGIGAEACQLFVEKYGEYVSVFSY